MRLLSEKEKSSSQGDHRMSKWVKRVIFIAGFLLCLYPLVSNMLTRRYQEDAVSTYQQSVEHKKDENLAKILEEAKKYNSLLYQSQGAVVDGQDLFSDEVYKSYMNITETKVMASLSIPKINVKLPVYHGTGEEVLANGIGHLKGTSLPTGGENTHCVLSGHRGLPDSKLLVRLDEMEIGDYIFVSSCNQKMAYKVTEINVVEPENVSNLEIKAGKDLLSLVTCTPYGLNTHRLIVTASRTAYEEMMEDLIKEELPSRREVLVTILPFVLLLINMLLYLNDRRGLKDDRIKKNSSHNGNYSYADSNPCVSKRKRSGRKARINTGKTDRNRRRNTNRRSQVSVY